MNKNKFLSIHHDCELELKRQQYRELHLKNPLPLEHGTELKECEGCYCQIFSDNSNNFCFDCRDCESHGGCCACYGSDSKRDKKGNRTGYYAGQEKQLSFTQTQRLHLERTKHQIEEMIEEIKEKEDPDHWWKRTEDIKRWQKQEKTRILNELTKKELEEELKRRKLTT